MSNIEARERIVFRSPSSGRTFLTAKSAARSEAAALLKRKYPTEKAEYEDGFCYYPGFYWAEDERLRRVHDRLVRMILGRFRRGK